MFNVPEGQRGLDYIGNVTRSITVVSYSPMGDLSDVGSIGDSGGFISYMDGSGDFFTDDGSLIDGSGGFTSDYSFLFAGGGDTAGYDDQPGESDVHMPTAAEEALQSDPFWEIGVVAALFLGISGLATHAIAAIAKALGYTANQTDGPGAPTTGDPTKEDIGPAVDAAKEWLGDGARVIKNKAGDTVVISEDGTKKVRFDFNNPSPHENPHGHVEELIDGKWVPCEPIYPTDVPHR